MKSKAVITVIGKDMVGIIAKVATECAKYNGNVIDVTQSILQDMFAMVMLVEVSELNVPFHEFADHMARLGNELNLAIHTMHEDIFDSMHRI